MTLGGLTPADLWWGQPSGARRAVGQHPADVLRAAATPRRRSVSAPVASAEHLPGGVRDLRPHEGAPPLGPTPRTPERTGDMEGRLEMLPAGLVLKIN